MIQGNLNEVMIQSAISVIPTAITMIDSLIRVKQSWAAAQAALNAVMNANPIMLIVTAIGLLIAAVATAYATCEPFRNFVNSLGAAFMDILKPAIDAVTGAFNWLWQNIISPFIGTIKNLWNIITNNPILAALFGPITTIAYLIQHWSEVTETLGKIWDSVCNAVKWAWDTFIQPVADALSNFLHTVIEPLTGGFKALTDAVGGVVNWFSGLFRGAETASSKIEDMTDQVYGLYGVIGKPPSTGLIESVEYLTEAMKDLGSVTPSMPKQTSGLTGGFGTVSETVNVTVNIDKITGVDDLDLITDAVNRALARQARYNFRGAF
jgi:hypothetical protein